ncbi:TonB-dependent siderophore receptor [Sphingomonas hankookensis]|uniref:TonB-dependent siderophore receptor n=1 Tax=Sphingomonas hankookensis TaxID=563996 RepID=UPI003F7AF668
MAALLAMVLPVLPAAAEPVTSADEDTDSQRQDDIVVVGKSYGQAVGKTVTPLKDVPNTITVIDQELLQQRNLFTLEDALTVTNGVTITGIGSEDPSYLSRGFTINNYLVDGVPTFSFAFPAVVPDLFLYDRVEVLRGPAGLFSGAGNPAGSINLVRKRPLAERSVSALAGYGSYQNLRAELDVSTPLDDHSGMRLGAMVQDQDQFFDVAHRYRFAAFGVADTRIGENTTLTVGGNYDLFKPAVQSGLPGYIGGTDGSDGRLLDVARSTYLGADWNRFRSESWSGFVELAHRVSDRWTLRATGLLTEVDRIDIYSYIGNQPVTPTNGSTSHIAYRGDNMMQTRSFDFNGVGSFPAFGRDQTLILGADYQASTSTSDYTRLSNYARIDVFNPVSPAEPPLNPYGPSPLYPVQGTQGRCRTVPTECVAQVYGGTQTEVEQYGLYGQMRLSPFAGVTLVGGGRMTWWDTTTTTTRVASGPIPQPGRYSFDERFTPYAGVVWDVTGDLNLYASYADSFTPQAPVAGRTRPDGRALEPLIGDQYEAGTKLSLMDKRLLLSAAVYQITQNNRTFNAPDLPTVVYQIGKVRARGVEAEASGEILPGWRINGGYSFTRTKYLEEANPVLEGLSLLPVIPEHMVKLFTNYAPVDGPLAGASVGAGVTWFDETWSGTPAAFNADGSLRTRSSIVRQGAYAVADLRAGYRLTDGLSVAVNVNNLFDRSYYARISSTGRGNYYGTPRTVFASIRATFP